MPRADHAAAIHIVGHVSTPPEADETPGNQFIWLTCSPGTSWPMRFKVVARGELFSDVKQGQLLRVTGRLRARFNSLGQSYLLIYAAGMESNGHAAVNWPALG